MTQNQVSAAAAQFELDRRAKNKAAKKAAKGKRFVSTPAACEAARGMLAVELQAIIDGKSPARAKTAQAKAQAAKPARVEATAKEKSTAMALVGLVLGDQAFGPKGGMAPQARKLYGQVLRGDVTRAQLLTDALANA